MVGTHRVRHAVRCHDRSAERTTGAVAEPPVHLTLGVAVLKGTQLDEVVRDATMLGASRIVPFVSAHVAVSERAWKNRSTDRWSRVASASASQCGRAVVPEIGDVSPFDALLSARGFDLVVMCVEPASGAARSVTTLPRAERAPAARRSGRRVGARRAGARPGRGRSVHLAWTAHPSSGGGTHRRPGRAVDALGVELGARLGA